MNERIDSLPPEELELQKRKFFSSLALKHRKTLELHKGPGDLWEKTAEKKRDWGNVSEHCLVETARVEVLAELLKLPAELKRELETAAVLHDYNKKHEIKKTRAATASGNKVLETIEPTRQQGRARLTEENFSQNVVDISESAGGYPDTLVQIHEILQKEKMTNKDIAMLIMNYVDAYTRNADWVTASATNETGPINDIDRRTNLILSNPSYVKTEEEAREMLKKFPSFQNKYGAEVWADLCHETEKRMTSLIAERSGTTIEPLRLPEHVDEMIKEKILHSPS